MILCPFRFICIYAQGGGEFLTLIFIMTFLVCYDAKICYDVLCYDVSSRYTKSSAPQYWLVEINLMRYRSSNNPPSSPYFRILDAQINRQFCLLVFCVFVFSLLDYETQANTYAILQQLIPYRWINVVWHFVPFPIFDVHILQL